MFLVICFMSLLNMCLKYILLKKSRVCPRERTAEYLPVNVTCKVFKKLYSHTIDNDMALILYYIEIVAIPRWA